MIAYHGEQALKDACITRMRQHREADALQRGVYYRPDADLTAVPAYGCAVGCLVGEAVMSRYSTPGLSYSGPNQLVAEGYREAYERLLGIPAVVARWEEAIFECAVCEDHLLWPERFLEAIPVGADLAGVDRAIRAQLDPAVRETPRTETMIAYYFRKDTDPFREGEIVLDALRAAPVPDRTPESAEAAADSLAQISTLPVLVTA